MEKDRWKNYFLFNSLYEPSTQFIYFTTQFSYIIAMSTAVFVVVRRVPLQVIHFLTNINNTRIIIHIHATHIITQFWTSFQYM
jgi:hypothetical protein